jgi:hypothetical protein
MLPSPSPAGRTTRMRPYLMMVMWFRFSFLFSLFPSPRLLQQFTVLTQMHINNGFFTQPSTFQCFYPTVTNFVKVNRQDVCPVYKSLLAQTSVWFPFLNTSRNIFVLFRHTFFARGLGDISGENNLIALGSSLRSTSSDFSTWIENCALFCQFTEP